MAFTDNCDLFGSVHEDGVNRVIRHIMRQRPSLFNYATADVAGNPRLCCSKIAHTSDVTRYGNARDAGRGTGPASILRKG